MHICVCARTCVQVCVFRQLLCQDRALLRHALHINTRWWKPCNNKFSRLPKRMRMGLATHLPSPAKLALQESGGGPSLPLKSRRHSLISPSEVTKFPWVQESGLLILVHIEPQMLPRTLHSVTLYLGILPRKRKTRGKLKNYKYNLIQVQLSMAVVIREHTSCCLTEQCYEGHGGLLFGVLQKASGRTLVPE